MTNTQDRSIILILAAGLIALIGPIVRFIFPLFGLDLGTIAETTCFGIAILGAAFLLSWTTEAAEVDISKGLAVAVLAFIAVLPEYAVDASITWRAGKDPEVIGLAVANMTGANRILIGLAWPMVFFIFWWSIRKARTISNPQHEQISLQMPGSISIELSLLVVATIYSFLLPLKGGISVIDAGILFSIFAYYLYIIGRQDPEEPDLMGPARLIGLLPKTQRRLSLVMLFLFSAIIVITAADPFAQGLEHTGEELGIDKFLLLQFVAPFASEAPEFLVCGILAARGHAALGMAALISSKLNQWTLLLGSLPLVFSASTGTVTELPLEGRQQLELFLTAAQSLFAVLLFTNLKLTVRGAFALMVLFLVQAVLPFDSVRLAVGIFYLILSAGLIFLRRNDIQSRAKEFLREARGQTQG